MPELRPDTDAYALLESSFEASPNLRSHKPFPRRSDDYRNILPTVTPLKPDDEIDSLASSQPTPLASPPALNGTDSGLPPTPPSNSQEGIAHTEVSAPSHADGVVASLTTKKSALSTPVNQRSPPTPDTTPPRTDESMSTPERPPPFTYPSSRAESFTTAREHPSSDAGSGASTPLGERLSIVNEDRSLGLAFEQEDDVTPRNTFVGVQTEHDGAKNGNDEESKETLHMDHVPNREWDTELMRNVTVRRKRTPKSSPQKSQHTPPPTSPAAGSRRRSSSLRERVEASRHSPHTPDIENFAKAIGWPTESAGREGEPASPATKRASVSSATSTVVEAMVIVTPPQRRRTLRHTGKNLAYPRDTDSPVGHGSATSSHRGSLHSDEVPLHKLVHKRASIGDRRKRFSIDSDTLGDRASSQLSFRRREIDSTAATLAHQESVRRVLQPAAEIMSRSNSVTRNHPPARSFHKRISSAPEPPTGRRTPTSAGTFYDVTPPDSPSPRRRRNAPSKLAHAEIPSPSSSRLDIQASPPKAPSAPKVERKPSVSKTPDINKSLPELPMELPIQSTNEITTPEQEVFHDATSEPPCPPSALMERVRALVAESEAAEVARVEPSPQQPSESPRPRASSTDTAPTIRRGSLSTRGRSEERRRSSHSQDRRSISGDTLLRPSFDRASSEEVPRASHEWHSFQADEHGRVSFDRAMTRTEEHAMARHAYAQGTPFSQFSDTPIEVSEATAVSIYPHNNHSLLVVQQVSRPTTMPFGGITDEAHFEAPAHHTEVNGLLAPPSVDADGRVQDPLPKPPQPTLTFEPSTPPMQNEFATGAVDSPLKNPRKPPTPPVIKFIPPTPAEELERQLPPGPPKRSDSHPQRRPSLKQRARRYSDNFISPLLARAGSRRGRRESEPHGSGKTRIPSVNDEDGTLHPFWRPRGFWDGFEDSDSESDSDVLPPGGDTSDVDDSEPEEQPPRKLGTLGRRLTNGFKAKAPGSFLIGNSLGVSRAGSNKHRPVITLPPRRTIHAAESDSSPHILLQPPTIPANARVHKRSSRNSLRNSVRESQSFEREFNRSSRRAAWRQGKKIPGLKGVKVQYIGLSGVKERLRERKAERRREALRRSIGGRWYVEPGQAATPAAPAGAPV